MLRPPSRRGMMALGLMVIGRVGRVDEYAGDARGAEEWCSV